MRGRQDQWTFAREDLELSLCRSAVADPGKRIDHRVPGHVDSIVRDAFAPQVVRGSVSGSEVPSSQDARHAPVQLLRERQRQVP